MRQQTFQKALSRMTETGVRLFFAACLLFALLTAIYNIWLCLAELVLILLHAPERFGPCVGKLLLVFFGRIRSWPIWTT